MTSVVASVWRILERRERFRLTSLALVRLAVVSFDLLTVGALAFFIGLVLSEGDSIPLVEALPFELAALSGENYVLLMAIILALVVARAIGTLVVLRSTKFFLAHLEAKYSSRMALKFLHSGLSALDQYSNADLHWSISRSTQLTFTNMLGTSISLASDSLLSVGILVLFFLADPLTALVGVGFLTIIAIVFQLFTNGVLRKAGFELRDSTLVLTDLLNTSSASFREIFTTRSQRYFAEKIRLAKLSAASAQARYFVLSALPREVFEIALLTAGLAVLIANSQTSALFDNPLAIGIYIAGGLRLVGLLLPIQRGFANLKFLSPQVRDAMAMLTQQAAPGPSIENLTSEKPAPRASLMGDNSIEFDSVSFSYPGASTDAIANVSFTLPQNSFLVIVGRSGAGKSTLTDLVLGLQIPSRGSVAIGGTDPETLQNRDDRFVGYAPQKPVLIPGTIESNVAFGLEHEQIDKDRVHEALVLAQLSETVYQLDEGTQTDVGKHADRLSGGQMQRLGIARALYFRPKLLVMDEPTSSLDAQTEIAFIEAINQLKGTVTLVVVTHRQQLSRGADYVLTLKGGRVHSWKRQNGAK